MYEEMTKEELINIINKQSKQIDLLKEELTLLSKEYSEKISKDNLTGLYNRDVVHEAYSRSETIIMCDIDDFKVLNDSYGHNFGDLVLIEIANLLKNSVRNTDYVIRWGGEEFVIFVGDASLESTCGLAERIRRKVEQIEIKSGIDKVVPCITMSFGVAKLNKDNSLDSDIEKVDEALYDSKKKGKNTITLVDDMDSPVLNMNMHK